MACQKCGAADGTCACHHAGPMGSRTDVPGSGVPQPEALPVAATIGGVPATKPPAFGVDEPGLWVCAERAWPDPDSPGVDPARLPAPPAPPSVQSGPAKGSASANFDRLAAPPVPPPSGTGDGHGHGPPGSPATTSPRPQIRILASIVALVALIATGGTLLLRSSGPSIAGLSGAQVMQKSLEAATKADSVRITVVSSQGGTAVAGTMNVSRSGASDSSSVDGQTTHVLAVNASLYLPRRHALPVADTRPVSFGRDELRPGVAFRPHQPDPA